MPHLQLSSDPIDLDGDRRRLARAAESGKVVRLRRGAYVPAELWGSLSDTNRYLARIAAVTSTRRAKPLYSHQTAAALWGLPTLRPWPLQIHVTVSPNIATRSKGDIIRHSAVIPEEDVVDMGAYFITSRARTVLDLAAELTFIEAVVVADRALLVDRFGKREPMMTRDELELAWSRAQSLRSSTRTRAVLAFAVTQAESPLESVSRVNLRAAGFPRPRLQVAHYDREGFIGASDFYWDEFGLIGEADGDSKYLQPKLRNGRSAEQVVLDEKIREDRLRAIPRVVSRWRWKTGISMPLLRQHLKQVGLPTGQKW